MHTMNTYARWLFGIAAAFNLAVGAALLFLRPVFLGRLGFDPVSGLQHHHCQSHWDVRRTVRLLLCARRDRSGEEPAVYLRRRNRKAAGAIGCAVVPWLTGEVQMKPPPLLAGDLILALLFLDYLRRSSPASQRK